MSLDFAAADLSYVIEDAGVPITYASTRGFGIFEVIDEVAVGEDGRAEVVGATQTVQVATAAFPGLKRDAAIIVGGATYTIRDFRQTGDGAVMRIWLRS